MLLALVLQDLDTVPSVVNQLKDPIGWVIVVYLVRWLTTRWEKQMENIVASMSPLVTALVRVETRMTAHADTVEAQMEAQTAAVHAAMSLHGQLLKDALAALAVREKNGNRT